MIDILAVCRQEMGMPLEKHLETMDAFHQGVYPVSESRTLNLLQQAGFSKIVRLYGALGRWVDCNKVLNFQALLKTVFFVSELSFMETKSERNDIWRTRRERTMAAHLAAEAVDVDAIMATSHLRSHS